MDYAPQLPPHQEMHVIQHPLGHIMSKDCWCEPKDMEWSIINGNRTLVVYHHDDSPYHHKVVLNERSKVQDWITLTLDSVRLFPPIWPPEKG